MTSREALLQMPDDALVPVRVIRPYLERAGDPDRIRWITASEARAIIDPGLSLSTLRSWAQRWHMMQERGLEPVVRVRKNTQLRGSHWLFDFDGSWAYRRQKDRPAARLHQDASAAPGVLVIEKTGDELLDHWAERVTQNLS